MLEVSSPGIDRPIARISDYRRFSGFEVKVETSLPLNGAKIFQGRILRVEKFRVWLQCGSQSIVIPLENVRNASLVPTEKLIKAAVQEAAQTAQMVPACRARLVGDLRAAGAQPLEEAEGQTNGLAASAICNGRGSRCELCRVEDGQCAG